jgi:mRNA-degrading endonuclease toxin of MazEF toxin-antitoxin module/predicted transcriptional regulator
MIICNRKSLLVQLDDATARALDRMAPPQRRQRSESVRAAICQSIRKAEFEAMREAYRRIPDSEAEADDWSHAEVQALKQYEIWWAHPPQPAGRHPIPLLSRPDAYTYPRKFAAAEITTKIRGILVGVSLGKAEGLAHRCGANFDNVRTIRRSVLTRRIGTLTGSRVPEVKQALGYALGWDELMDLR